MKSRMASPERWGASICTASNPPSLTPAVIDPADASGAKRTVEAATPLLPVTLDGERLPLRMNPLALGEHTGRLLGSLGFAAAEIADLRAVAGFARRSGWL